jgi:hypothetical protein
MSGVQVLTIGAEDDDQRLDRWLKRQFPHLAQGRIEKMCRKGELRIDGGRVKASTRLSAGQNVRIPPLGEQDDQPAPLIARDTVSKADYDMIRAAVIWKDDHIIALNKPPGLPTQGGSKQLRHIDGMTEALRFGYDDKPRLVHRLDKDTSGLLLLARTRDIAAKLTAAMRHRETRKIIGPSSQVFRNPIRVKSSLASSRPQGMARVARTKRCVVCFPETWIRRRVPSARIHFTRPCTASLGVRHGSHLNLSPGERISCAHIWPR